jgi:phosphohistidine swiveling domain-containing protein
VSTIVRLGDARDGFGGKAGHLAALLAGGFEVPDGFAIAPDAPLDGVRAHLEALGDVPVAVRSSAIGEDGTSASFAGIYDSILDVRGVAAVEDAIAKVRESARSSRALSYRHDGTPARMGVVVQRLVRADAAGVMFTADPVTGDRDARVVTAVRGLGEALVSGEQVGEEWLVRGDRPRRRRALAEPVLSEDQVRELVAIGDRVAAHFGAPQDIEWVIEDGRVALVQARPITALPDRVEWKPPRPKGFWSRNFRWGEWLSDPVSPLFATWFLPRAEATFAVGSLDVLGVRQKPPCHDLVNGWYFYSPMGSGSMVGILIGALLRRPGLMLRMPRANHDPVSVAPLVAEPYRRAYEEELAPRHRAFAAETLGDDAVSLIAYVDRACDLHGELMFNITLVGGFAWKVEAAVAKFFRAHCKGVEGAPHELVAALSPVTPCAVHHACSIDWMHPTAGELGLAGTTTPVRGDPAARREALERACLEALSPELRARFEPMLALARQYARVRESQAHDLTLAWPNVRRALLRLGEAAHARGAIAEAEDIFWLRREELDGALDGTRRFQREVAERRAAWGRQRKLAPPLVIGDMPGFMKNMFDALPRDLRGGDLESGASTIAGMPASAGRATGKVRLVRSPADFDRLEAGEVLVAPTTAPAWTPLFARAVAVVTDSGSVVAHASLVAREYGIPAVVATVDATQRLHDGQLVTVDGTLGRVDILDAT